MFIDEVTIQAKAGDGGRGCVSFRREKTAPKGGPNGGDGGKGGDVVLVASKDVNHLIGLWHKPILKAQRGGHGLGKNCTGPSGADCVVAVPLGTVVRRESKAGDIVADLTTERQRFVLCKGGRGGRGNQHFARPWHQAPREFEEGKSGEEGAFYLELKLMADAALIGYPNAGKSTILSKISKAHPKIAAYPFTTLTPNVGTIEYDDFQRCLIADVPGLIEGAHEGRGLGDRFLRHIERCRVLLVVVDMAGTDNREPLDDYRQVLGELDLYDPQLLERPRLIVANKLDVPTAEKNLRAFRRKVRQPLVAVSAEQGTGLDKLRLAIREKLEKAGAPSA
jgi:GTP-binding protein